MKIIHTADLHIGAKVKNINNSELSDKIQKNLSESFRRLVEYAKDNEIKIIMLSGDVFDSDKVTKSDKNFFYSIIKGNEDIDFIYLKGNHDKEANEVAELSNLKTFENTWKSYEYEDIVISGVELDNTNYKGIYSALKLDKNKTNIVMLHGNEATTEGVQNININKLKKKDIDYLALGHIHKKEEKEFEEGHQLVYPGCLTGHGFDETNIKGFYVLDVDNHRISKEFVPLENNYVFYHEEVNLDETNSEFEALKLAESKVEKGNKNIYELILTGKVGYDTSSLEGRIKSSLEDKLAYLKIKNKTYTKVDISKYETDKSLKGEFVRQVNDTITDDELKSKVINMGLKLLDGEDID